MYFKLLSQSRLGSLARDSGSLLISLLEDSKEGLPVEMMYTIANLEEIEINHPHFYLYYSYKTRAFSLTSPTVGLNITRAFFPCQMLHGFLKKLTHIPSLTFHRIKVKLDQCDTGENDLLATSFWDSEWRLSQQKTTTPASNIPYSRPGSFYVGMENITLKFIHYLGLSSTSRICLPACGGGELVGKLFNYNPKFTIYGFDQSLAAVSRARNALGLQREGHTFPITIENGDITDVAMWEKNGTYDVIIAAGILTTPVLSKEAAEHALEHITHALRRNGHLIIYGNGGQHFTADDFQDGFEIIQEYSLEMKHPYLVLRKLI